METEEKIKHLEIIQGVINRLANNSFLIKGWMLTISLAGFGFFIEKNKPQILFFIIFNVVIFWFLDSYFLRQEKLFRKLYDSCANNKETKAFTMDISKYQSSVPPVFYLMWTYPTLLFYFPLIVISIIVYFYA